MNEPTTEQVIDVMAHVFAVFKTIQALGYAGIIVSLAYGPSGDRGCAWSVMLLHVASGDETPNFEADDPMHALRIAIKESRARGWYEPTIERKS